MDGDWEQDEVTRSGICANYQFYQMRYSASLCISRTVWGDYLSTALCSRKRMGRLRCAIGRNSVMKLLPMVTHHSPRLGLQLGNLESVRTIF